MAENPKEELEHGGESAQSAVFVDSGERARENRSSAWALLAVGCIGLAAVALGLMGVLPLQVGNPYLFYGVMSAIFILFLVMGAVSMRSARLFARKARSEDSLRDTIRRWCRDNLRAEEIDAELEADAEPEEILYLGRTACMKEKINRQFMNLDQNFVEHFIDEVLYDEIFGRPAREREDG